MNKLTTFDPRFVDDRIDRREIGIDIEKPENVSENPAAISNQIFINDDVEILSSKQGLITLHAVGILGKTG